MALGNANTQAQSRGKNKPVIVKRRKEVVLGKSLNTVSIDTTSAPNGNAACKLPNSNANTVVYHDGPSANRILVGTKVYTIPRLSPEFILDDGFYHFDDGRGSFGYFEIVSGTIDNIDRCP
tara:strand:+ start:469 stop:831 length:363 start_codon:yes stop_codon:yes gene_type:complete